MSVCSVGVRANTDNARLSTNPEDMEIEMHLRTALATVSFSLILTGSAFADNFLIHIHTGADDPTKAALGFLVAATAINEGHHVDVFLAGDGATLITDEAIGNVVGTGTGKLQDALTTLSEGSARIYISGMSAKARDITEADLAGKPAEFAMPKKLVELAAAADVVITY